MFFIVPEEIPADYLDDVISIMSFYIREKYYLSFHWYISVYIFRVNVINLIFLTILPLNFVYRKTLHCLYIF